MITSFDVTIVKVWRGRRFVDVRNDMGPVLQVNGHLDDVDAHVNHMPTGGTIVASSRVAFESVG